MSYNLYNAYYPVLYYSIQCTDTTSFRIYVLAYPYFFPLTVRRLLQKKYRDWLRHFAPSISEKLLSS